MVFTAIYLHVQLFNVQFITNKYRCIYCTQTASRDSLWLWQLSGEQKDTGSAFEELTCVRDVIEKQTCNQ